jgi:hypothetical protein
MKQTAVEWLIKELQIELGWGEDLGGIDSEIYNQTVSKAKEMEKTSMCYFTTGYVNNCVEIDHNEIELTQEVEEYYDYQYEKQNENN